MYILVNFLLIKIIHPQNNKKSKASTIGNIIVNFMLMNLVQNFI